MRNIMRRFDSVGAVAPLGYGPNNPYDSFGAIAAQAALAQQLASQPGNPMAAAMSLPQAFGWGGQSHPTPPWAPNGCGQQQNTYAGQRQGWIDQLRGHDIYYGVDTGATLVAAGATATITTQPQVRHVPRRMVLTAAIANNFVINDFRVGVNPVFATTGVISAAVFMQDSQAPDFRATVCDVGQTITVQVTNITGAGQRFTSTILGRYLPYCDPCGSGALGGMLN